MRLAEIDRRLEMLEQEFQLALTEAIDAEDKERCNTKFAEILAEQTALKQQREEILKNTADADHLCSRMKDAEQALQNAEPYLTEWNETTIRQLVERVTVLSKDEILVRFKGGREIRKSLDGTA